MTAVGRLPPRWRSLAVVGVVVFVLGVLAILLNGWAAGQWAAAGNAENPAHPDVALMFPYLGATVLFFSACVWVVLEADVTVEAALSSARESTPRSKDPAVWALIGTFVLITMTLVLSGMAGPVAMKSIRSIDYYLRGVREAATFSSQPKEWERLVMPFNYVAAMGNAAALATLVYLGCKCQELTKGAWHGAATPALVVECTRAITSPAR